MDHVKAAHEKAFLASLYQAKDNLQKPTEKAKKPKIKLPCSQCKYKARKQSDLIKHVQSYHEGMVFPCDSCEYKAKDKSNLNKHRKYTHGAKIFACNNCEYKAKRTDHLQYHQKTQHERQT